MRIVKVRGLMLFVFLLLFLSGCRDYNELNMQALVNHAGVDFDNGEVSVCVVCTEEKESFATSRGKSFFEAVREMSGRLDKKLYWGHAQTIVFGEEALKGAFSDTLDAILRARDVYPDIVPVAVRGGSGESALASASGDETPNFFEAFANSGNSRRFEAVPLWRLLRSFELFGVCVIPSAVKNGDGYIMSGGAVVAQDGFRGYLSPSEMLCLSLLTDSSEGGYLPTIEMPDGRAVSFEILANDLETKKKDGTYTICERVTLSPAEVRGDFTEAEMKELSESYLSDAYRDFSQAFRKRNFGNILNIHGASGTETVDVLVDVKVSNVPGGV